jgi:hypothetical protein
MDIQGAAVIFENFHKWLKKIEFSMHVSPEIPQKCCKQMNGNFHAYSFEVQSNCINIMIIFLH